MNSDKNNIIRLNPRFVGSNNRSRGGGKETYHKNPVTSEEISELINELNYLIKVFSTQKLIDKLLVTTKYKSVVSKSRRIKEIFKYDYYTPNHFVVGSSFFTSGENEILAHQITYYVSIENINNTIRKLNECRRILDKYYEGIFLNVYLKDEQILKENKIFKGDSFLYKSHFYQLIIDISNIESFIKYKADIKIEDDSFITLFSIFDTKQDLIDFINKLDFTSRPKVYGNTTLWFAKSVDLERFIDEASFLITQSHKEAYSCDYPSLKSDISSFDLSSLSIKKPTNEPTIGVFDTFFDNTSYFNEWVECISSYPKDIYISKEDMEHGTKVTSIIVDGPRMNPDLDDKCGNFKVKLYEVGLKRMVNFDYIYNHLEEIIVSNPDIKVWNFSLGTIKEVSKNQISLLGAKIDEISCKYNVIFVISGTNIDPLYPEYKRVGSPADSLNSIVVNAVDKRGEKANYSRKGPVLTLYTKPDVCYYGGDDKNPLYAYSPTLNPEAIGTSFAAPWITRKLAYLIHYLGMEPLVAKALIIDSATKWDLHNDIKMKLYYGYGLVPIDINDIVHSDKTEIRFFIGGKTLKYHTELFNIPVPLDIEKGRYKYSAKATLCYFTNGNRKNGVDYSSIEMNVKFGPYKEKYTKDFKLRYYSINSINQDKQFDDDGTVNEHVALERFQKWNNVKHLVKPISDSMFGFKQLFGSLWGLQVTQHDRLEEDIDEKYGTNFGLVITLKNIKGESADINSFMNECSINNLNPIMLDLDNEIGIFNKIHEEVKRE